MTILSFSLTSLLFSELSVSFFLSTSTTFQATGMKTRKLSLHLALWSQMAAPTLIFANVSEILRRIVIIHFIICILRQQIESSSQPFIFLSGCQTHSVMPSNTSRIDPQETRSLNIHPPIRQNGSTVESPNHCFIIFLEDHSIVEQVVLAAGRCRVPHHPPLHKMSQFKAQDFRFSQCQREF